MLVVFLCLQMLMPSTDVDQSALQGLLDELRLGDPWNEVVTFDQVDIGENLLFFR